MALTACGKLDGGGSADASDDSANLSDSATGAKVRGQIALCPLVSPVQGSPCAVNGLECEFGDDYDPRCNAQLVCSSGKWAGQIVSHGSGVTCPTSGPPVDPAPANPTACPASLPSGACSGTIGCTYGDTLCACGPECTKYPIVQCHDAGIDWRCGLARKPNPLCATPRPRLGEACSTEAETCRVSEARAEPCEETNLVCHAGKWTWPHFECPASQARYKENIHYLETKEVEELARQLLAIRLTTYTYRQGVADRDPHLGFIIDDQPLGSPAVSTSRDRVDLYGYVSTAVAAIQTQSKAIEDLRREVDALKANQCVKRRPGSR